MKYEAPKITTVGSVSETTLGQGIQGNDDQLVFFGYPTGLTYGTKVS